MTYDALLQFINLSVLPAWALLILAPRWKGTRAIVHSMLYPLVLGGIYIGCFIAVFMGEGASGGSFTSIEGIRALFLQMSVLSSAGRIILFLICLSAHGRRVMHKDVGLIIGF